MQGDTGQGHDAHPASTSAQARLQLARSSTGVRKPKTTKAPLADRDQASPVLSREKVLTRAHVTLAQRVTLDANKVPSLPLENLPMSHQKVTLIPEKVPTAIGPFGQRQKD
jgi:hypothetical protein